MQSLVTTNLQTAPDPGQRFGMSSRGHHANGDQREWRGNNGPGNGGVTMGQGAKNVILDMYSRSPDDCIINSRISLVDWVIGETCPFYVLITLLGHQSLTQ